MHYFSKYLFFTTGRVDPRSDGHWPKTFEHHRVLTWQTPWFYIRIGSWQ